MLLRTWLWERNLKLTNSFTTHAVLTCPQRPTGNPRRRVTWPLPPACRHGVYQTPFSRARNTLCDLSCLEIEACIDGKNCNVHSSINQSTSNVMPWTILSYDQSRFMAGTCLSACSASLVLFVCVRWEMTKATNSEM